MSEKPDEQESFLQRGCFLSGVVTVLVIVLLKRIAFRLPFMWVLLLAAVLWLGIFMAMMRRRR
jgi:hydrogenase/urease accessory protein HupE